MPIPTPGYLHMTPLLSLHRNDRLTPCGAGRFVSRGRNRHPARRNQTWELFHVRHGTLHLTVAGERLVVPTGQALLVAPGEAHVGTRDYERDLAFDWLHFRISRERSRGPRMMTLPRIMTVTRPGRFNDLIVMLQEDTHRQQLGAWPGHCLLGLILDELATPRAAPQAGGALAQAAVAWIAQHHHETIGIREVATAVGCHPDHLGRVFRSACGHTVGASIQGYRIDHACRLLEGGDQPVAAVAHQVGWQAASQFRAIFLRRTGLSPDAWRRERRGRAVYVNTE